MIEMVTIGHAMNFPQIHYILVTMNNLDKQYQALLQDILDNGVRKEDRTGTGTLSVFGRQIRHKMSEGFPLLTTKKMPFRLIATELMWFLRGDTNIKYLVDNDCHIWDGDAYKAYLKKYEKDKLHGVIYENDETQNRPFSKEEFINWVKNNDKFSELYGELGPIYGKQWREWSNYRRVDSVDEVWSEYRKEDPIDQIENLINDLKTNPDSRRLMVSAWNVGELDQMTLPPCHYGFQVYTRELSARERTSLGSNGSTRLYNSIKEGNYTIIDADTEMHKVCDEIGIPKRAISLMWNQRSVDTFLGLPFNIASYGLLLEIIATATNMVPDELIGNLGDTHLYANHIEQAKEQIGREPFKLPRFNINTEWWPTESGECGVGPIDATAIFNSFSNDDFCKCLLDQDLQLANYQAHPTIKAPLSN
jgi:thymidylate synthase